MENKIKVRTNEQKNNLNSRLNRINGQINGIKNMIDENRYCGDIIIQISAAISALKQVGNIVLDEHLHSCVVEKVKEGDNEIIDEVVQLFKKLQ